MTYGIPIVLLIAIGGSYVLARSALAPVNALVRTARAISDRDLGQRLPVKRPNDELGQLAMTINSMLDRLDTAFRQRDETLTQQRRFVADASHELRTPLTSIQGYARMLRHWAIDDPATARESIAAIEREAARMHAMVESLLALVRGEEGVSFRIARHDLRGIAAAAVADARATARGTVGIIFQPPASPAIATFDAERVRQVASILLDNAIKYTPVGGTITVTVSTTEQGVALGVADTGIGIAPEAVPHIFERFYRVDIARSTGGAGLGLAIARQIADAHQGSLEAFSTLGRGSTFTLTLPRSAVPESAVTPVSRMRNSP